MGTVVGTVEDRRDMFEGSAQTMITPFSSTNQIGNPVAYKLVRVSGDGSLVPATDEEILEVNETDIHIASDACQTVGYLATDEENSEVNETDVHIASDACQTVGYLPAEGIHSRLSQLESSEAINSGLLQSDNVQPYTDQYNEEMLLKVEKEERLGNAHGSQMPSTPPDANIQCSNENNFFEEDQVHHEALLQEPVSFSMNVQNECKMNESDKIEPCSNAAASPKETAFSAAAQKPDFSRVRGEICLDNLPIKALQETFRATFGRETTVKDKTWLKRRIAMGLINSCDVPTTNLRVKDSKLVVNQEKSNDVTNVVSKDMGDDVRATKTKDAPSSTDHVNGHSNASGHILGGNLYYASEDYSSEQRAAKRVRKPTRRYIEELSETDEKQQNDKSMIPSKDQSLSEKSEVRSISVSSGKRITVTRMVSLAGSEIEVPYVSHVRRSRPRENIMALMGCHSICLENKGSAAESNLNFSPSQLSSEVVNRDSVEKSASRPVQKEFATSDENNEEHILSEVDQDMEPEHIDSSGNSSDDNNDTGVPIMQGGALRRKHHRAWTLSEVTKLVEGVSKYGAGKWSEIKKHLFSSHSYRTSVDLKDKWRNLLKTSFAQSPSNSVGSLKKHGSMHIPMQILLRVRELAEKQSQ
ncbi:SANT/Myb domain [Arabidopsis thaliana x Arabidopsis arenosa]|uniref:SANT/Myb domain n=1 Tax=Arabidopsis thaliana x Arabidopsis arenosa TaxID=1240361 RepID=A0A8T2BHB7_9BRAS|nr:SANT/Myb domain [Arabidopsis thaliana x Arabidopsis arenosa]